MSLVEINFDGIIGPSHNYAGLSLGNLASTTNALNVSQPRIAALQGLEKMRYNLSLGLTQGLLFPLPRPNHKWLHALGTDLQNAPDSLRPAAFSASSMWAANAATVSPAPDTKDGRCHITVANLNTMPHRSHEWPDTYKQLQLAFADDRHFQVHAPVPDTFGDEGAANHMRLCSSYSEKGVEIFVYGKSDGGKSGGGKSGGAFPARQHIEASKAVARLHGLDPERTLFVAQAEAAIAAGAFHNDVVALSNENVLFAHEQAFENKEELYTDLRRLLPDIEIIEVPASAVSLADAVKSYVFNAQLVTLPGGGMALIVPKEARETSSVWKWLIRMAESNGPIRELFVVDVRQSMANGGGPACLRLRVVADPATIDPRFIADEEKLDRISSIVSLCWPVEADQGDLRNPYFYDAVEQARKAMLSVFELKELI